MKRSCAFIFALAVMIGLMPFAYADYHPYHHHHGHYRGGYVYCSICHLYHPYDHSHIRYYAHPAVVEHGTSVDHETVSETEEVVE